MKETGIVRKLDELGRVVLPVELRKTMDLSVRDAIEIFVEDDKIILKKHQPSCAFCGGLHNMLSFHGKLICSDCIQELKQVSPSP